MTANSSHYPGINSLMANYRFLLLSASWYQCQPNFEGQLRDYLNSLHIYIYLIIQPPTLPISLLSVNVSACSSTIAMSSSMHFFINFIVYTFHLVCLLCYSVRIYIILRNCLVFCSIHQSQYVKPPNLLSRNM